MIISSDSHAKQINNYSIVNEAQDIYANIFKVQHLELASAVGSQPYKEHLESFLKRNANCDVPIVGKFKN